MQPPKRALAFLRWFCREDYLEEVEGDLTEVFIKEFEDGPRKAKWKFAWSVIRYFRPEFMKSLRNYQPNTIGMYRNYFKIGWRNLTSNKILAALKIVGLSVGLSACMLIFLYTKDEVSYDQFHDNKARLYRVIQTMQAGDNPEQTMGITNGAVGEGFASEIPEIEQYVRINGGSVIVKKDDDIFTESSVTVDDNCFTVFSFPLLAGNKRTALNDPHSIVLSKHMAEKFFGSEDIIGEILQVKRGETFEPYTITAIAADIPQNSSIKADLFFGMEKSTQPEAGNEWLGGYLNTFMLLAPQSDVHAVEKKMQDLFDNKTKAFTEEAEKKFGMTFKNKLSLQPLTDIHLSKNAGPNNGMTDGSNSAYGYILTCIAVFILIIACINFSNLSVSQSLQRSKEVGIRKVVGSTRKQLIRQFLTESFLVSLAAFTVAIVLTIVILPFFNTLANKKLSLLYLTDGYLFAGYFLLLLLTAFISGFYPSLILSAFQPVKVLYSNQKLMGRNYVTKGLVVLQFALAVFFIIGTIGIYTQLNFLMGKELGYDSKNLVRIDLPSGGENEKLVALFKNELSSQPDIVNVAAKNGGRAASGVMVDGKQIFIEYNKIDDKFLPTFRIPVIAGRNFSPDFSSDSTQSVIVNESLVKEAGWEPSEAVGKTVVSMDDSQQQFTIVGVVKDYHFTSLREKIKPEMFSMTPAFPYGELWVKISPGNIPQTLALLQNTYRKLVPYHPYSYQFMDDINAKNYETEVKWKQIITYASVLFILISCIGLSGLVMLSVEQRTKEIGIRKVLGAAGSAIVMLISRQFILLVSIGFLVAVPFSYLLMNKWLQDFAYRIDLTWWMFAMGGLVVIAVALLTMAFQAAKAALMNPVKSLRSE